MLQKTKTAYLLWHEYHATLPKTHRYSLGQRIDTLFVELIEALAGAAFFSRQEKLPYIKLAIRKLDALKILLLILWETKSLDNKKYIALSVKVDEIGRMLGGWNGQLTKASAAKAP
ncbi:MAG: four helix bundle protein [Patescibacteria group bacterium]